MDSQTSCVVLGCGEETQLVLRKAGVFVRVVRPAYSLGADVTLEVTAWSEEENWTADREAIAALANEALAALGVPQEDRSAIEAVRALAGAVTRLRAAEKALASGALPLDPTPEWEAMEETDRWFAYREAVGWMSAVRGWQQAYRETARLREVTASRRDALSGELAAVKEKNQQLLEMADRSAGENARLRAQIERAKGMIDSRQARLAKLDELLASEEPPAGLGEAIQKFHLAPVRWVAWTWLREQLGATVELLQQGIFTTLSEAPAATSERNATLAYLKRAAAECYGDGDSRYGSFVEDLHRAIAQGEHLVTEQPQSSGATAKDEENQEAVRIYAKRGRVIRDMDIEQALGEENDLRHLYCNEEAADRLMDVIKEAKHQIASEQPQGE